MANQMDSYQTKTAQYLMKSAMLTSLDAVKYTLFADVAAKEDRPRTAALFAQNASYKKAHAEILLRYLGQIGDTVENTQNGKGEADADFFREGASYAREEGYAEIADAMESMAKISEQTDASLEQEAFLLTHEQHMTAPSDTRWRCENCGQEKNGNLPPESCTLCGLPKTYFTAQKS